MKKYVIGTNKKTITYFVVDVPTKFNSIKPPSLSKSLGEAKAFNIRSAADKVISRLNSKYGEVWFILEIAEE